MGLDNFLVEGALCFVGGLAVSAFSTHQMMSIIPIPSVVTTQSVSEHCPGSLWGISAPIENTVLHIEVHQEYWLW